MCFSICYNILLFCNIFTVTLKFVLLKQISVTCFIKIVQCVTTFVCNTHLYVPMKLLCNILMDVLQDYVTKSMFCSSDYLTVGFSEENFIIQGTYDSISVSCSLETV